jgi:predicted kinase
MNDARLLVITGLPASGKTTLARQLSERYGVPLIAKDVIKEPLLDVLGANDAAESRRLSDASFAILFALAREMLKARCSVVLEGNFRPAEHATALQPVLRHAARVAQVLCQVDEATRIRRLLARATDPARHAGHRDAALAEAAMDPARQGAAAYAAANAEQAAMSTTRSATPRVPHADHGDADLAGAAAGIVLAPSSGNDFLSIPGERYLYDGRHFPLDELDAWWRS